MNKTNENYVLNIGENQYNSKTIFINLIVMIWIWKRDFRGYNLTMNSRNFYFKCDFFLALHFLPLSLSLMFFFFCVVVPRTSLQYLGAWADAMNFLLGSQCSLFMLLLSLIRAPICCMRHCFVNKVSRVKCFVTSGKRKETEETQRQTSGNNTCHKIGFAQCLNGVA